MFSINEQRHCPGYKGAVNITIANTIFLQSYLNSYNELYVCPILSTSVVNLGQNFQKLLMLMSGFVPTERAQKMPVPKFFKLILTWSRLQDLQDLQDPKSNPFLQF